MSEESSERDLFGAPVSSLARGRGRPAHAPTRETQNRVLLGFARGWSVKDVASSIGVSVPTLREHYSSAVAMRAQLRLMVESVQLGRLNDQAEKGNVTAEKELMKALDKGRLQALSDKVATEGPSQAKAKSAKLGKKEQQRQAASQVTGKFAPPPAPTLLN